MNSDADVPIRSVELESDEFACGAYSITQAMTRAGGSHTCTTSLTSIRGKRRGRAPTMAKSCFS